MKIKILPALKNIFGLNHQVLTLNLPHEGSRIAPTFHLIHFDGSKAPATVSTDHIVTLLVVTFTAPPTDITGIKSGADHTVRTLQNEIFDKGAIPSLKLKMPRLSVVEEFHRADYLVSFGKDLRALPFHFVKRDTAHYQEYHT